MIISNQPLAKLRHQHLRIADQLIEKGKVTRGFLGLNPADIDPDLRPALKVSEGAYVSQVSGGGPADLAGVEAGDVITRFGSNEVRDEVLLEDLVVPSEVKKGASFGVSAVAQASAA